MPRNPIMHMLVPGRRALGEDWSKVTIYADDNGEYRTVREDTTAPAENCAIFVPAMGNMSYEAVDYLLEYKRKDQEYRKTHNLPIKKGWTKAEIEQLFYDWCEFKAKALAGKTVSGPHLWAQRERIQR